MPPRSKPACAVVLLGVCLSAGRKGEAAISTASPLEVRVLYDNSGSMYPGYAPPGRGGTPRLASGALFFHQYPELQQWLADFVARQAILGAEHVSIWASTSDGEFRPGDMRQVHPRVPLGQFDAGRTFAGLPDPGSTTYLAETLAAGTRGFEGLAWLITDNIAETRRGEPSRDVELFFRTLRDQPRYRSVHLFKYPFRDPRSGRTAALAVYGILVSDAGVPAPVLAHFDRKLRSGLLTARRRQGNPPAPLFPGREHLKLKELAVDALELQAAPNLEVVIEGEDRGLFKERQTVRLELRGNIRSYLTQHSVTGGRYTLEASKPFGPELDEQGDLGIEAIGPQVFAPAIGTIGNAIPPSGSREIAATLQSRGPLSLSMRGFGAWLRTAAKGAVVNFTGSVRMSFEDVEVKLERERMAGIYGIDRASSIFDFQDVQTIRVEPSVTPVSFRLKTSPRRTALLLLLLAAVVLPLGLAAWLGSRRARYEVHAAGAPPVRVALRRLAGHDVTHEGQRLGRLTRGLAGTHEFAPNRDSAAVTLTPGRAPGTWDVLVRDQRGYQLRIEPPPRQAEARDDGRRKPPQGGPGPGQPGRQQPGQAGEQPPASRVAAGAGRPRISRFSITTLTTLKGLAMRNRFGSGNRAAGAVWARSTAGLALAALWPGALAAQVSSAVYEQPENMLLWWAGLALLLAALWFILYKIVYPFFLRYYRDDFCKTVFWNLFILYGATLGLLFSYFPLGIGFYHEWTKWLAAFLCALWLISLMVLMLRRRPA